MLRVLCVFGGLLLASCAAQVGAFVPGPLSGPRSVYSNGAPILFSRLESSEIAIGPAATVVRSERIQLTLLVRNTGDQPVTVGPGNLRVSTETGAQLRVYTATELEREARSRAAWAQFAAGMQMMSNSMAASNAGYSSTYGSSSGTMSAYGAGGSAQGSYSGIYGSSTYDSTAAAQAQLRANQQNAAIADQTRRQTEAIMADAQTGAFQIQTITPGGSYYTPVTIERLPRDSRAILVELSVGNDLHRVDLVYSE